MTKVLTRAYLAAITGLTRYRQLLRPFFSHSATTQTNSESQQQVGAGVNASVNARTKFWISLFGFIATLLGAWLLFLHNWSYWIAYACSFVGGMCFENMLWQRGLDKTIPTLSRRLTDRERHQYKERNPRNTVHEQNTHLAPEEQWYLQPRILPKKLWSIHNASGLFVGFVFGVENAEIIVKTPRMHNALPRIRTNADTLRIEEIIELATKAIE